MTLDTVRERMAECLRKAGVEAVCAWPGGARRRVQGPVAAVSLRSCQGGPGGFRDYRGERYNQERGCWEELYGRKVRLVFGLDLYAPGPDGAPALRTAFDVVAGALQREGPEELKLLELSCGEVEDDPGTDLLRCPAEAVCEGWLYAVADEAGAFLDFIVRGDGKV